MLLTTKNVLEMLEWYEFDLEVSPEGLHLVDLQGANLGGIEEEVFADLKEVVDRLSTYHEDYIIRGIENQYYDTNPKEDVSNWEELLMKAKELKLEGTYFLEMIVEGEC